MSVPLDRLYNFLQDICNQDVLIYRFFPHGSKNLEDCLPLSNQFINDLNIKMVCHDQESLSCEEWNRQVQEYRFKLGHIDSITTLDRYSELSSVPFPVLHELVAGSATNPYYDHILLLHSELNSLDVKWFEDRGSVAVYWWSHAVIARDWFRYAEIDPLLTNSKSIQKTFLIYNRAWSGLREYRIKFTELVLNCNLQDHCQLTFNTNDSGQHWLQHKFTNSAFEPTRTDLDQFFQLSEFGSTASADYASIDYNQTLIEVVLETVFDDNKLHLTEKSLRPLACGHPFILVSTPGSLKYLKQYGFRTFSDYFDESYDSIQDPVQRLEAVVNLMKSIAELSTDQQQKLQDQLAGVCQFNKERFFSKEFFDQVVNEFKTNFSQAFEFVVRADSHFYYNRNQRLQKLFFNRG